MIPHCVQCKDSLYQHGMFNVCDNASCPNFGLLQIGIEEMRLLDTRVKIRPYVCNKCNWQFTSSSPICPNCSTNMEDAMPKGTRVHKVYEALLKQGKSKASAAKIAQAQTGLALATGRKPKKKKKK